MSQNRRRRSLRLRAALADLAQDLRGAQRVAARIASDRLESRS